MSNTEHAFDFLNETTDLSDYPVIVLFGDGVFLKSLVLNRIREQLLPDADQEINFTRVQGDSASMKDVRDQLSTVSLFGGGRPRVVLVEDADKFISDHRDEIEKLLAEFPGSGVLLFDVVQWARNTRLFKTVDKIGKQVECRVPTTRSGKSAKVNVAAVSKWFSQRGKDVHGLKINRTEVEYLLELLGPEMGLIEQSLAKLALYLDSKTAVTEEHIDQYIGGWQMKSVWDLIDLALAGKAGEAVTYLDRLISNGEKPIALFGQLSWALRRLAVAIECANRYSRQGKKMNVDSVLSDAGFRFDKEKAKKQLKLIGRERAGKYFQMLLECDLALKSSHSGDARGRVALEKLVLGLVDGA